MIDAGEISLAHTRQELPSAITAVFATTTGDIRADARADDVSVPQRSQSVATP
ncbi:hypothetical protein ACFVSN_00350 [Kitasatospora sp. NPDC057904]|uniref:hypothetical protein n=1 Tax=unclassified Kitasatospora TaxID=2633591 RepID=UPI0036D791B5